MESSVLNKRDVEASRFLSYVLRHRPDVIGLTLDHEGWADVDALIKGARKAGKDIDLALIRRIVDENDKKRYSISQDSLRIRAVQGHSVKSVAMTFAEKDPPETLYHGTATRHLGSIMKKGLLPGNRHHVHLSEDRQSALAVGSRYGNPVVLIVDTPRMIESGHKFFQAENGVWLVECVPSTFLTVDSR